MTKWLLGAVVCTVAAWGQTPSALVVKQATSKRVDLAWTGNTGDYVIERRTLGGTYATAVTVKSATAGSDLQIDGMATYQYRVRATTPSGTSDPSNEVTIGPPPVGFSLAAPATQALLASPSGAPAFGQDASMTLDTNDDPAFAFLVVDPQLTNQPDMTELWFQNWNRAQYRWNAPVKVAVVGDVETRFHTPVSLAQDRSNGTWGIASEESPSYDVALFLSPDGVTWTRKTAALPKDTNYPVAPSLALAGGSFHLSYNRDYEGTNYSTGKFADAPEKWTTRRVPLPAGTNSGSSTVSTSLALDSDSVPGIAYWLVDTSSDYNRVLAFWRAGATDAVRVTDTQGYQSDNVDVKLTYQGKQPRILLNAQRDDSFDGKDDWVTKSDDGGATWQAPVQIPTDGGSHCVDTPFDLSLDSKGRAAMSFDRNCGSGDDRCPGTKLSRSGDLVNWSTCSVGTTADGEWFDSAFASIQVRFAPNDKLYVLWQQTGASSLGQGLMLWREQ